MFDFGIPGYRPHWLTSIDSIRATHSERLAGLAGRSLRHVWLVWDLEADEWFADCPVLIDFGGQTCAINHQKFDELSITFDDIDPSQPIAWPTSDDFDLAWRHEPLPGLAALAGQRVEHVDLLESVDGTLADGMVALALSLTTTRLTVYNALDENGLNLGEPGPGWCQHRLA